MPEYIIVYLGGGQPSSLEEDKRHLARYMGWLASSGHSVVSSANPFINTIAISLDDAVSAGGSTAMSGYTIIKADSMGAALTVAKACPFLDIGGLPEISELLTMPGPDMNG